MYWTCFTDADWQAKQAEIEKANAVRKAFRRGSWTKSVPANNSPRPTTTSKATGPTAASSTTASWRDAHGGWFSYEVKIIPDQPTVLRCTYWGSDSNQRIFDILVDGEKIAEQKLDKNKPDAFFEVEYPLPAKLTHGKTRVTIKFQAHPNATAGGLFGLLVLKANP